MEQPDSEQGECQRGGYEGRAAEVFPSVYISVGLLESKWF